MTLPIFPNLPGITWGGVKKPVWSTAIHQAASGVEASLSYWSYPRWIFGVGYEVLRDDAVNDELNTLMGFFNICKGAGGSFLFSDPFDNTVTSQMIALGDGATKKFQITKQRGGFVEPIKNLNGSPLVYLNGVNQVAGWTVDPSGIITFTAAPGAGVVISATFSFYFACRFMSDVADFTNFMYQLWELKNLQFVSLK